MSNDILNWSIAVATAKSSLVLRSRRLKVRCRARGTKELCVLLDRFLSRFEGELDEVSIAELEELLLESDDDILSWVCRVDPWPKHHESALKRIRLASNLTNMDDEFHSRRQELP